MRLEAKAPPAQALMSHVTMLSAARFDRGVVAVCNNAPLVEGSQE
jgi:hypothetical protein